MAKVKKVKAVDTRLSHSSATLLRGCEQKYCYYKVDGAKKDPDHEESNAFVIGKAFHHIIEKTEHKHPKKILPYLLECTEHEDIKLQRDDYPLIIGMVHSYCNLHEEMGLSLVACEEKIEDDYTIGFIDAIFINDKTKEWWISDNKTYAFFSPSNASGWANHVQLNLYAFFANDLANKYGLKMSKFRGCRIRVTTKPRIKKKNGESLKDYALRFKEVCSSWDIEIPIEKMDPDRHMVEHRYLQHRSMQLREGEDPERNYDYCMQYFKPCEYWSQCHGDTYTNCSEAVKVVGA